MDKGRLVLQDSLDDLSARSRDVTAGFAGQPDTSTRLPDGWLTPTWSGRTLRFATTAYRSDDDLKGALDTLRTQSSMLGSRLSIVETRQQFTAGMIDPATILTTRPDARPPTSRHSPSGWRTRCPRHRA